MERVQNSTIGTNNVHIVEFRTNSSNNQKKPMKSSNMRAFYVKEKIIMQRICIGTNRKGLSYLC
jgi:hypothetical protein